MSIKKIATPFHPTVLTFPSDPHELTFWAVMLWNAVITMYTDRSGTFTNQRQQLHEAFAAGLIVCMERIANRRLINTAYYIWYKVLTDTARANIMVATEFVYDFLNVCCNLRTLELNESWETDWANFQNGNSHVRAQEPAPSNSDPDLDILL